MPKRSLSSMEDAWTPRVMKYGRCMDECALLNTHLTSEQTISMHTSPMKMDSDMSGMPGSMTPLCTPTGTRSAITMDCDEKSSEMMMMSAVEHSTTNGSGTATLTEGRFSSRMRTSMENEPKKMDWLRRLMPEIVVSLTTNRGTLDTLRFNTLFFCLTVADLKKAIEERTRIPVKKQILWVKQPHFTEMRDSVRLSDYFQTDDQNSRNLNTPVTHTSVQLTIKLY